MDEQRVPAIGAQREGKEETKKYKKKGGHIFSKKLVIRKHARTEKKRERTANYKYFVGGKAPGRGRGLSRNAIVPQPKRNVILSEKDQKRGGVGKRTFQRACHELH